MNKRLNLGNLQRHFSMSFKQFSKLLLVCAIATSLWACQDKTAAEYIAEAEAFEQEGNANAAVVALKNAIQQEPRNANPRFALGKIYLEQRNFDSAEKELSRALELGYSANQVIPLLAQALQRTGANVALSELDTQDAQLTPAEKLEVGFRQLQSLVQLEKNLKAQQLIDELLALNSDTVYKGLIQGYQSVLNQDFANALVTAKAMYERSPLNRDVLNFTARLYMLNEQPEEAADIYENYVKVAPDDLESKFALASMLVEQRKPEQAEKYIDELLAISDTNPLLNQLKGVVRAAAEDYEGAKQYSEKAINSGRADPTLRLVAGLASYKLDDFEAAVGHLSFVASVLPDNHPGLRILAASQLQSNMGDDAGEILTRVKDINADDATLFSKAGYELLRSGNTSSAKAIIEQAEKISESAEDLTRLGVLKLSINDIEGLVDLQSAVEKSPESVTAKATLASAYLGTNQLDKASELAAQWQQETPDAVEGFLLEAEVLQRQKQFDKAAQVLNSAPVDSNGSSLLEVAQIRLDMRIQKFDDALVKTESLLQKEPQNVFGLASYFALKSQNKQSDQGSARLQSALSANPDNQAIRMLVARSSLSIGNVDEALEALQTIKADRTAPNTYWPMMGMSLLRKNKVNEALAHYQNWADIFPNQVNAVKGQLLIHDNKREYAEGARVAGDYLRGKDDLEISIMLSYFYVMSNNVEGSKRTLRNIGDEYHALPFLRGVKARIALAEKRGGEAVEDAMVAYDANKNPANLIVLLSVLDAANQQDAAFTVVSDHVSNNPDDMQALMLLAGRQIERNQADALASYEKVLAKFPNNFVVLNNSAYLHMELGNLEQAYKYAQQAYDIQPDNVATADTYAQILIRQGNIEDAVKAYNRVMNDKVTNEEIFLNYLEALWMNGNSVVAERRIGDLILKDESSKARLETLKAKYAI